MTTLKGIFPNPKPLRKKNYLQENVKSLRRMEIYFHSNKEAEKLQKLQMEKQNNKYQNIAPRVNSSLRRSSAISGDDNYLNNNCPNDGDHSVIRKSNSSTSVKGAKVMNKQHTNKNNRQPVPNINLKHRKTERHMPDLQNTNRSLPEAINLTHTNQDCTSFCGNSAKMKCIDRGSQTMSTSNIDVIYSEGVFRYPSSDRQKEFSDSDKSHKKIDLHFPIDRGDNKDLDLFGPEENTNFVKANKEISVTRKMAAKLNNGVVPSSYRKGTVPKYIIDRKKEQLHQQIEKAKIEKVHADCPQGHVPLPDNERKETLLMLKKNYEELVNELNKLPIRSDTLRSQRRKMELEQKLKKLEDGIKVFSRPKVFIKTTE